MLSIGELSRVTQLSIKALRLYHEKGILIPNKIDMDSKYRYYHSMAVEKALIIKKLKEMGFSLQEIKEILEQCSDDSELAVHVEKRLLEVKRKISEFRELQSRLSSFMESTDNDPVSGLTTNSASGQTIIPIERIVVPDTLICGIRFKGRYSDVGPPFTKLFKHCGRWAVGKPFSLYYDTEFKEEGADIEVCVQIKKEISFPDIHCRTISGCNAVSLIHRGPYPELGRSYLRVFEYCRESRLTVQRPTREHYIKGPGMIFKGNPKKFLTRILIPVTE